MNTNRATLPITIHGVATDRSPKARSMRIPDDDHSLVQKYNTLSGPLFALAWLIFWPLIIL